MENSDRGAETQGEKLETQPEVWTIKKLLAWSLEYLKKFGSDTPRLDAQLLLAHTLNCQRLELLTQADKPLLPAELSAFKSLIKRRALMEPVAYILGEKGFMQHTFKVNSQVLVPRPETELLVEMIVEAARQKNIHKILEIGAGSGCIALSLAHALPNIYVESWDNSAKALEVAGINKSRLGVENCHFFLKDALDIGNWRYEGTPDFDIIVSNPPYLRESEYGANSESNPIRFEPKNALVAGEDGLIFYHAIAQYGKAYLKVGGTVLVEIGYQQARAVTDIFAAMGWHDIAVHKDLNHCDRMVVARRSM